MIIGVAGYARVGKHEFARGLEPEFRVIAFADKLREFLYTLNPMVENLRLQRIIDYYGWEGYKESPWSAEIRELIQRLGTDCGRNLLGENVWIDATLPKGDENVVVADVRFLNEMQAIRDRGGFVVRLEKPGVGPVNSHISETSLDDVEFDKIIINNGTIAELHKEARAFANEASSQG